MLQDCPQNSSPLRRLGSVPTPLQFENKTALRALQKEHPYFPFTANTNVYVLRQVIR